MKRKEREEKIEEEIKIPLFYRIILKIPKLSLESFSENEKFQGIFWAAILPSFLICELLFNMLLITMLSFPFNFLSMILVNSVILLLILRILAERALNGEKAYLSKGFDWNPEESLKGYLLLIRKKDEDKKGQ
ncbi:MAG: hypothetical protein QHH17_00830 [Candidatus Bathyarchaeota archaeon]|nr:hypothetical protein [Candidatus Bathyarchaeota archaeon]